MTGLINDTNSSTERLSTTSKKWSVPRKRAQRPSRFGSISNFIPKEVIFVVSLIYTIQFTLNLCQVTLRTMIQLHKYLNNRKGHTLDQENCPDTRKGTGSGVQLVFLLRHQSHMNLSGMNPSQRD